MAHHNAKWTKDEDAVLLRMRDHHATYSEIARKLPGRTRNMVAGRVNRLGLCKSRLDSVRDSVIQAP